MSREGESKIIRAQGTSVEEYASKRVQNYRENLVVFQKKFKQYIAEIKNAE